MKVWYCTHDAESTNSLDPPNEQTVCWLYAEFDEKPDGPCQMVEMELHPAGSRVVTAEALVIEKVDGEWPEWAIRAADRLDWVARITLDDLAEGQDALAQSKEGAE